MSAMNELLCLDCGIVQPSFGIMDRQNKFYGCKWCSSCNKKHCRGGVRLDTCIQCRSKKATFGIVDGESVWLKRWCNACNIQFGHRGVDYRRGGNMSHGCLCLVVVFSFIALSYIILTPKPNPYTANPYSHKPLTRYRPVYCSP